MTTRLARDDVVAVDFHTHVERSHAGDDHLSPELRSAVARYFKGDVKLPVAEDIAAEYRRLRMMAVVFTVDSALTTGQPRVPNGEIAAAAAVNDDVLVPFASIDPRRGADGVAEARELLVGGAMRGLKFHPNLQQFHPNDPVAYPLYEVAAEAGAIVMFHSGHSGIGAGLPGGGGIRLKYSNPMAVDDVAVDFPDLRIVLAHPSFPWQDEALSVAMHKPQVSIDLSGWSPKRFPPTLVEAARRGLRHQVLFGSDYPLLAPQRWIADFASLGFDEETTDLVLRGNAFRLLGLD